MAIRTISNHLPRWRDTGLRSFSGLMAFVCGAAGIVLAALIFAGLGSATYSMLTGRSLNWSAGEKVEVSSSFESKAAHCADPEEKCQKALREAAKPNTNANVVLPMLAGMAAAITPGVVLAFGLVQAGLCFLSIAGGKYLERRTVRRLIRFAVCGLIFVMANPLANLLGGFAAKVTTAVLSFIAREQAETQFTHFNLKYTGAPDMLIGVYAITLTIIALVMVRASRIAEDHAQIV